MVRADFDTALLRDGGTSKGLVHVATPPPSLSSKVITLSLTPTRLQVDDQHRRSSGTHRHDRTSHATNRRLPGPPQRVARGQTKHGEKQQQRDQHHHPRQLTTSTTISPIPLSTASTAPTARRGPRRVNANQIAALQTSTSPTTSTTTNTSPANATTATTTMTTGATSATTAATRGHHGGRATKSLPGVAGVTCTIGPIFAGPTQGVIWRSAAAPSASIVSCPPPFLP